MYNTFFGFRERPFQLVPNPDYLYLSRSHEEALAHLKYAVTEGEGFVEITGEVGTGKTTLCRAFLENMADDVEKAYIFNPKLDAVGLLRAINDEFGIRSDLDSTKALIDELNVFLMAKKAEGKQAVLLIDEAQNLGADVLEQLRLLSNLETTKEKLLQIILVGQPELGEMLDSHELRQLAQRISLSCRLTPLTFQEMGGYIRHRIHVASQKPSVRFTWWALRQIYRYSRGLPRLVNIACDRCLLFAYGKNIHHITGGIARSAIGEIAVRGHAVPRRQKAWTSPPLMLAALTLALAAVIWFQMDRLRPPVAEKPSAGREMAGAHASADPASAPPLERTEEPGQAPPPTPQEPAPVESPDPPPTVLPSGPEPPDARPTAEAAPDAGETETVASDRPLADLLRVLGPSSRQTAASRILALWGEEPGEVAPDADTDDDPVYFTRVANRNRLEVYPVRWDLGLVRKLNLPAVLSFLHPEGLHRVYLAVVGADEDTLSFLQDKTGERIRVPVEDAAAFWTGAAYVFWKNSRDIRGVVGWDAEPGAVEALQTLLVDTGIDGVSVSGAYDAETRKAVKTIQAQQGIMVDGYVGPLTKIVLYQLSGVDDTPRLSRDDEGRAN